MSLIVFEDSLAENFYPLTFTRASFELLSGTKTLLGSIVEDFAAEQVSLFARSYLNGVLKQRLPGYQVNKLASDGDIVVANALLNTNSADVSKLMRRKGRFVALSRGKVVAARVPTKQLRKPDEKSTFTALAKTKEYDVVKVQASALYRYPWELVDGNAEAIGKEAKHVSEKSLGAGIHITGPKGLALISQNANLEPPVALNTVNGPVMIDEKAAIQAMSRLEGPCYIGRATRVRSALIGGGTSIGNSCVVGGEIEHSIIQGYSNKAHLGYLGHSIVGSWVNLGAQTTNSNLKNTYGTIKTRIGKQEVSTSRMKAGCYIADDAKTAIGSLILAGKSIGVASHLYGIATEEVPSFTIYAKSLGREAYEMELDSAIETQKRMMSRRGVKQTREDATLLRKIFRLTSAERVSSKVIKGRFKI